MKQMKIIITTTILILIVVAGGILYATDFFSRNPDIPSVTNQTVEDENEDFPRLTTIAENLEVPWSIAFLPDGDILTTERRGTVQKINPATGEKQQVAQIAQVLQNNESGLHGIDLHPEFENNNYVYTYYTYAQEGNNTLNRVSRHTFEDNSFKNEEIIVDNIPGAQIHDGGRIKFGPDGYLYIATGDASEPSLSQNTDSLGGKILRVTDNGESVPENPFNSPIYSYGHRNPQGLTWDSNNTLWATEHGPSARDELNRIEPGNNYGWPEITGNEERDDMLSPVLQSGSDTWAPSGAAHLNNSIFFTGLRSNTLFEAVLENGEISELRRHFEGELGRLRAVTVGPDNMLYITTSNRDGRGVPTSGDDRIIRVNPIKL